MLCNQGAFNRINIYSFLGGKANIVISDASIKAEGLRMQDEVRLEAGS
jgi:hypothetical protein